MNKKRNLVIFCMIFVGNVAFAQKMALVTNVLATYKPFKSPMQGSILLNNALFVKPSYQPYILPTFYYSQLGFFCKQEIKLEKITKIPFRFRLGSVEDCDRLEGKRR